MRRVIAEPGDIIERVSDGKRFRVRLVAHGSWSGKITYDCDSVNGATLLCPECVVYDEDVVFVRRKVKKK